jgi:hypothetical protein
VSLRLLPGQYGEILVIVTRYAFIVLLALLGGATSASAKDLYVAQSPAGLADASSCANAWALDTLNTPTNWATGAGKVSPGDTVRLCGTIASQLQIRGSGSPGSYITITAEPGSKFSRTHWTTTAIEGGSGRSWIIIDGVRLEATASGTGQNPGSEYAINFGFGCSNCEIRNNTISSWYVRTAGSSDRGGAGGIFAGGGSNLKIYGNTVEHTAPAIMYTMTANVTASNLEIYNNITRYTTTCTNIGSGGDNAVLNTVKWYANTCQDLSRWSGCFDGGACQGDVWFHCDGLHVWAVLQHLGAQINNLEVFNNTFIGPTCVTTGVGPTTSGWIFLEGREPDALIYNNVIVGGNLSNGHIFLKQNGVGTAKQVYNNTIVGIGAGNGVWLEATTAVVIKNNLFIRIYRAIGGDVDSSFASVDYNAYAEMTDSRNTFNHAGAFSDFAGWQGAGFDTHGFLDNTLNMSLDRSHRPVAGSRLIDAGTPVSAACPGCATDRAGVSRPQGTAWDIGAFEFVASGPAPPSAPLNLRIVQ